MSSYIPTFQTAFYAARMIVGVCCPTNRTVVPGNTCSFAVIATSLQSTCSGEDRIAESSKRPGSYFDMLYIHNPRMAHCRPNITHYNVSSDHLQKDSTPLIRVNTAHCSWPVAHSIPRAICSPCPIRGLVGWYWMGRQTCIARAKSAKILIDLRSSTFAPAHRLTAIHLGRAL